MPFLFQNAIIERLKSRSAAVRLSVYVPARRPAPVRRRPAFGAITVQLPQDRQSLCRRVVECKTATGRDGANPGNEGSSKTKRWRVTMRGVAVPYAVLAAVLVLNAAVAQNDPGQPSSPSSPSAKRRNKQTSTQTRTSHRQSGRRRLVIANPARRMCRPRSRKTWASDRPRTRPSTGSCASVAIADLRCVLTYEHWRTGYISWQCSPAASVDGAGLAR